MSQTVETAPPPPAEEPVERKSLLTILIHRPEVGALVAALAIFVFFFAVAEPFRSVAAFSTVLYDSSTIGIMAVGVALLMIGGEFDLSAGVAVITAALTAALVSYELSLNLWVGTIVALVLALMIGYWNGWLTMRTGIPSFLITLSTFFMLQGLNLGVTKLLTGTVATTNISNMDGFGALEWIFASSFTIGDLTVRITVVWWLLFTAIATWLLLRTRVGNWIFAVGGNAASARAVGVPLNRVKIGLFMGVGFLAWFYGMHRLYRVQHRAVRGRRGQRVPVHHRRSGRRVPADRGLRFADRGRDRRVHLRHDPAGHRVRRLGRELVPVLPGGDAPAGRAGEPVGA